MPTSPPSRWVLALALISASACARDRAPAAKQVRAEKTHAKARTASVVQAGKVTPASSPVVIPQADTGTPHHVTPKLPTLTDAEQRIADGVVFAPRVTERFLVASRNKRLLVDVGRVDFA